MVRTEYDQERKRKKMNEYKDFTIVVDLKGEAITLDADSADEAIAKAKEVIKYQYGESVANDADYKLLV
jgi:hypothetical protein